MKGWEDSLTQLNTLYTRALSMPVPKNHFIGQVVYANAIGASFNGPDMYMRNWTTFTPLLIRLTPFSCWANTPIHNVGAC